MQTTVKIQKLIDVNLSANDIAAVFCDLSSTEQAEFFVRVSQRMVAWKKVAGRAMQCQYIGRDLREHEETESANEARTMLEEIARASAPPTEVPE